MRGWCKSVLGTSWAVIAFLLVPLCKRFILMRKPENIGTPPVNICGWSVPPKWQYLSCCYWLGSWRARFSQLLGHSWLSIFQMCHIPVVWIGVAWKSHFLERTLHLSTSFLVRSMFLFFCPVLQKWLFRLNRKCPTSEDNLSPKVSFLFYLFKKNFSNDADLLA